MSSRWTGLISRILDAKTCKSWKCGQWWGNQFKLPDTAHNCPTKPGRCKREQYSNLMSAMDNQSSKNPRLQLWCVSRPSFFLTIFPLPRNLKFSKTIFFEWGDTSKAPALLVWQMLHSAFKWHRKYFEPVAVLSGLSVRDCSPRRYITCNSMDLKHIWIQNVNSNPVVSPWSSMQWMPNKCSWKLFRYVNSNWS